MTSIPPPDEPAYRDPQPGIEPSPALRLSEYLADDGDGGVTLASVERQRARRRRLPLLLFLTTAVTTYCAGAYHWSPTLLGYPANVEVRQGESFVDHRGQRRTAPQDGVAGMAWHEILVRNWRDGLIYMACVMSVLLLHEMGHFLTAVRHRVPASFPFFIPLPLMLTGTMGAVISMDGLKANRKELFDIGIAGPLAGLVLTIPLVFIGLQNAKPMVFPVESEGLEYGDPLLVRLLIPLLKDVDKLEQSARQKEQKTGLKHRYTFRVNALYMAGWVGMLVTGLNMLPISQLDGGHVSYAVLGKYSRWLGRAFLIGAIVFIVWTDSYNWTLMLVLVILIGTDHPPTADDRVDIGPLRRVLGVASLAIPIFCFPPFPLTFN